MKASFRGQDFWAVGQLDTNDKIFRPLQGDLGEYSQLVDVGKYYASKSFFDPIGDQQITVGWVKEDDDQGQKRKWQGIHSLPRYIFLSDDGLQLRSKPVQSRRIEQTHRFFRNIPFELIENVQSNQTELIINFQKIKLDYLSFNIDLLFLYRI